MISPSYVQTLSRYNTWQNNQVLDVVKVVDQSVLDQNRAAFFGSLQGTLSHLLWGDLLWMSRFDANSTQPPASPTTSAQAFVTKEDWALERLACDQRIMDWANGLGQAELDGDLTWTYSFETRQVSKPMWFAVTHFFNHQTHHRGQIHAMLTSAGLDAPVSDLSYLPKDS